MSTVLTEKEMKNALMRHFSCSESMLTLLNRMGGCKKKELEEASDPLCGGILGTVHDACGLLWGASLAAGLRAKLEFSSENGAAQFTLAATQRIIETFEAEEEPVECASRIEMDKWSMIGYMMKGNTVKCQESLARWVPRFNNLIKSMLNGADEAAYGTPYRNCACETLKKTMEQLGVDLGWYVPMAAGFGGGLGLSGNACGALTAAILGQMLKYFINRNKPKHSQIRSLMQGFSMGDSWMNPSKKLLKEFTGMYGTKSCRGITQRQFATASDLSAFLESGGCSDVMANVLTWVEKG